MNPITRPLPAFLYALLLATAATAQAPTLPADRKQGGDAVSVEEAKKWLHHLAGPELAGRGTGQPGFQLAAEYVRDHFKALGLEPGANGEWFQVMPWTAREPKVDATSVTFEAGDKKLVVPGGRLSGSANASTSASGEAVLLVWDEGEDLEDADVQGKVVVITFPPTTEAAEGRRARSNAMRRQFQAVRAVQGKGAAAIVFANKGAVGGGLVGSSGPGAGNPAARARGRMPTTLTFGGEDFDGLMELTGLKELPPAGVHALKAKASVEVVVEEKPAPAYNVCGLLKGSDPKLAAEYVVIGSHLDHLGRENGNVYPGADDDGSGTTGVMAVSQMFAKNGTKPARSVMFVCFCGEEKGLLGSRHFADNLPIPAESIVAELQMDMIGRDEEENMEGDVGELAENNRNTVHLIGTKQLAPALHELCLQRNEIAGLDIEWDQEGMFSRSDHANFARLGIPIAFFFTGLHRDYHQTTDTPDKIHYEKLLRIARWVYDIGFELGTQAGRPEIDPTLWEKYRGKGRATPAAPMRKDK
jgi:Peptidase family M28